MDPSTNFDLDARNQDRHPQFGHCTDRFHSPTLVKLHDMPISPMCSTGPFHMPADCLNKHPCSMSLIEPDKQPESLDAEVSDNTNG